MMFVDPAAANARLCLKVAGRINVALKQALGQGIDVQRMVVEPLYARDVLLVCDALREHQAGGTAALAQQFRQAKRGVAPPSPAARVGGDTQQGFGGFSASRFLSSIFGPSSTRDVDIGTGDSRHLGAAPPRQQADIGR